MGYVKNILRELLDKENFEQNKDVIDKSNLNFFYVYNIIILITLFLFTIFNAIIDIDTNRPDMKGFYIIIFIFVVLELFLVKKNIIRPEKYKIYIIYFDLIKYNIISLFVNIFFNRIDIVILIYIVMTVILIYYTVPFFEFSVIQLLMCSIFIVNMFLVKDKNELFVYIYLGLIITILSFLLYYKIFKVRLGNKVAIIDEELKRQELMKEILFKNYDFIGMINCKTKEFTVYVNNSQSMAKLLNSNIKTYDEFLKKYIEIIVIDDNINKTLNSLSLNNVKRVIKENEKNVYSTIIEIIDNMGFIRTKQLQFYTINALKHKEYFENIGIFNDNIIFTSSDVTEIFRSQLPRT